KSSKRYNEMPGLISWAPAPACLFAVFAGRERPAVDRLLEELVLPIGPELADVRIGLDDGVPKLGLGITEHLLFLDLLDVDVLDRVALGIEAHRAAHGLNLHALHGLDELRRARILTIRFLYRFVDDLCRRVVALGVVGGHFAVLLAVGLYESFVL